MKKIVFVSDSFRMGGIQKSLKTLLQSLNYEKYEVYLYLFNDAYPEDLPKELHTIKSNFLLRTIALTRNEAKEKGKLVYFVRMLLAGMCKIFSSNFVYSSIFLFTKKIGPFDTAISFSNNGNPYSVYFGYNAFVLKKVKADKKITFLHVNYESMQMNNRYNRKEYPKFDCIACVSEDTKKTFLKYFPQLEGKTKVIYNLLPVTKIKEKITNPYREKSFIIVSAGRLDDNKNPMLQLKIANELKGKYNFHWYLLGEGPDKERLLEYIKINRLETIVSLLGNKEDAYRYLKYANVYISTSKSESYGLSIAEALYLKTPVLALDYPALKEIIKDDRMICNNEKDMIKKLEILLEDDKTYQNIKENICLPYEEEDIMRKIETIF